MTVITGTAPRAYALASRYRNGGLAWLVVGAALLIWIFKSGLDKELYVLGGGITAFGIFQLITASLGNSGPAEATLAVDADLPGFSKSFAPNPIPPGGTSILTFTIDNSANTASSAGLEFLDTLPAPCQVIILLDGCLFHLFAHVLASCRPVLDPLDHAVLMTGDCGDGSQFT